MKTVAADWNVHVRAAYYFDSSIGSDAPGKMGVSEADLANSSYLMHRFGHWYEIQNIVGWERWVNRLYEFEEIKI